MVLLLTPGPTVKHLWPLPYLSPGLHKARLLLENPILGPVVSESTQTIQKFERSAVLISVGAGRPFSREISEIIVT